MQTMLSVQEKHPIPVHFNSTNIAQDLFGRFDTIVSVDEINVWEIPNSQSTVIIKLKVYPAEVYEYKRLQRELKQRMLQKFGINHLSVELDW